MRGSLSAEVPEVVELLHEAQGPLDVLGQRSKGAGTFTPYAQASARIQPLGADATASMGLEGVTERLRLRLPAWATVKPNSRVHTRGKQWKVLKVEAWGSYVLAFVEAL